MRTKTKAFLLNLLCFAVLFVLYRFVLLLTTDFPYLLVMLMAAILASLSAPKFLVKKEVLWMKLPWRKAPYKC
jgi:phosphoribulokinase